MKSRDHAEILGRLHLEAVLPALELLVKIDPEARRWIEGWNFSIQFCVWNGPSMSIFIHDHAVTTSSPSNASPQVKLLFPTASQLNRTFSGKPAIPPWICKGISRFHQIQKFQALARILENRLRPDPSQLHDPLLQKTHAHLALLVALLGIPVLGKLDPIAKQILAEQPEGLAEFSIPQEDFFAWVGHPSDKLQAGAGQAPRPPDVQIAFESSAVVTAALRNELDPSAALGQGKIRVRGLLPLAEGLNLVLERLPRYLVPS